MQKKTGLFIITFVLILISRNLYAQQQEKQDVVWSIIPYAPIHILDGQYQGQGIADTYLKEAQSSLAQYHHINQVMTPARAWHQIAKQDQLICHPSALKTTEREAYAYFSQAAMITPVIRALMTKRNWKKYFANQTSINIASYLAKKEGSLGIVSHRSYGEHIDRVVERGVRENKNIVQASGRYGSRQLFEMLINGRIDMMLEYPWVTAYFNKVKKNRDVELVNLNISDFPSYSPSYVACSRNEEGKKLIEKLNAFIERTIPIEKNRQRMMDWLDASEAAKFEQDYLEFFKIAH
jgi:uncharacterized protein (TIGR02285 family)